MTDLQWDILVGGFRFQNVLWVLMAIPVIIVAWMVRRRRRGFAVLYSNVELLRNLPVTFAQRVRRKLPLLRLLGLLLIVVSLARPQHGREEFRIRTEGIAIEMCVDRSGSMLAEDFSIDGQRVNRLAAVKDVFRRFVAGDEDFEARPDDLIGLVAFGGFADALCPPTLDHSALLDILKTVKVAAPIQGPRGEIINDGLWQEEQSTAIGDAIAVATDRLKDIDSKTKIIILLSDGENTAGAVTPEEAAEAAKEFGIKIYAIGAGSSGLAPFPAITPFGETVLRRQEVRLDETALKELAQVTGGQYFNAKNSQSLKDIYGQIDELEKTETEGHLYTEYRELFQWFLIPGVACILFEVILSSTRFRSLP